MTDDDSRGFPLGRLLLVGVALLPVTIATLGLIGLALWTATEGLRP